MERDYCLAWFLVAISRTPLRDHLAFKGGTALKMCYFGDYRFSEDLDFTRTTGVAPRAVLNMLDSVFAEARRASGIAFRFSREDRREHGNSYTFYVSFEGPLPAVTAGKEVKVDITLREQLVFPLEAKPILRAYEEYEDLPDNGVVRVYSLPEIALEKILALADRARNEPRDLYDLWYLVRGSHVDLARVRDVLGTKAASREQRGLDLAAELVSKEARLRRLWDVRLSSEAAHLPEFDDVFRAVRRALRAAGFLRRAL